MAAWIDEHKRSDGVVSCYVRWRTGGARDGKRETETFSIWGSRVNRSNAEAFADEVDRSGQQWPEGWVRGSHAGKAPAPQPEVQPTGSRTFLELALESIDQKLDAEPGVRRTYRSQVRRLVAWSVDMAGEPYFPFAQPIEKITEADLMLWRRKTTYGLKTQANYCIPIMAAFRLALKQRLITHDPSTDLSPSNRQIEAHAAVRAALTEKQFATLLNATGDWTAFIVMLCTTGLRFGEITALWVGDIDLDQRSVRVSKGWKRNGDDGEQRVPPWLARLLKAKHRMRGCYLGQPKSVKGNRRLNVAPTVIELLRPLVEGRPLDDFLFLSPTGLPVHSDDFSHGPWERVMKCCRELDPDFPALTPHGLRHSHLSWLGAGGVDQYTIQERAGHESAKSTAPYMHALSQGADDVDETMEALLAGVKIENRKRLRIVRNREAKLSASG